MSRFLIIVVAVLIVLVGGTFWLAGRNVEKAPAPVEKAVSLENLS
ncbi:hypothetical protein [Sphingomonas sp.]|nr:hypothetical protein [Sphingomonas sp.]HWK35934.1 hypothetical protein [Sphingomonas sp.]